MLTAQKRRTKNQTMLRDYLDPDALCILIRNRGGAAYVEGTTVITDQSLAWCRRLAAEVGWIRP